MNNANVNNPTWKYLNQQLHLQINRVSEYLSKDLVKHSGDSSEGEIHLQSHRSVDDIFGGECKIKINWKKIDPTTYHHGLKVKETIRMFSSINVVVTSKESRWHLSHEMTYWYGTRQKVERGRYYQTSIIHAIMFCELTYRVFEVHAEIYSKYYPNYQPIIMEVLETIQCHGS